MDPVVAPAAPTPSAEAPKTVPAADAAVASGKTTDYRAARRAERAGTPLRDVALPATTAAAAADRPDTTIPAAGAAPGTDTTNRKTRAEREQDRINDTIRAASEAASAPLKAEIARLTAQLQGKTPAAETTRPADAVADPPPAAKTPDYKRIMALEGAPKLADFDSVEEHAFAAASFIQDVKDQERRLATDRDRASVEMTRTQLQRVDGFLTKLDETKKADPEFTKKVSAEVKALKPFGALNIAAGEQGGPANVVAEQLMDSPMAPAVMLHLSQAGELAKLIALPPAIAAILDEKARTRAHVQHIVREFNRLEGRLASAASATVPAAADDVAAEPNHISAAPEPGTTLGSRPVEPGDAMDKAIKRGDTRTYRELRRQERAAGKR